VPESTRDAIDEAFRQEIAAGVKDLTVTFNGRIKGGFRIEKKDNSYQISFTDEDFIAFFQSYLNKKTRQLLFDEKG
jgi:V/A-type H+-transporting ATPase subunit E